MKLKRIVIASAAAAGIAGVAFGGQAVSTAFTSSSSGHVHANSASIAHGYQTGDLTLDNAIPGDSGPSTTIGFTNDGSTAVHLVLTITNPHGSDALANDLVLSIDGVGDIPLTAVPSPIDLGRVPVNGSFSGSAHLSLSPNAGNEALNKSFAETYTLTATATQ
jgi:hypothetical protein